MGVALAGSRVRRWRFERPGTGWARLRADGVSYLLVRRRRPPARSGRHAWLRVAAGGGCGGGKGGHAGHARDGGADRCGQRGDLRQAVGADPGQPPRLPRSSRRGQGFGAQVRNGGCVVFLDGHGLAPVVVSAPLGAEPVAVRADLPLAARRPSEACVGGNCRDTYEHGRNVAHVITHCRQLIAISGIRRCPVSAPGRCPAEPGWPRLLSIAGTARQGDTLVQAGRHGRAAPCRLQGSNAESYSL